MAGAGGGRVAPPAGGCLHLSMNRSDGDQSLAEDFFDDHLHLVRHFPEAHFHDALDARIHDSGAGTTCPSTWTWRQHLQDHQEKRSSGPSRSAAGVRDPPSGPSTWRPACSTPPRQPAPGVPWMTRWLMALVLVSLLARPTLAFCPQGCVCNTLRISCENAGLDVVPFQLNPEANTITLRGNNILTLEYTVNFYQQLQSLDISQNRLQSLGSKNLDALERLVSLNVSGNEISTFGKDAFKGLRSLRILDLSDNLIENLERNMFAEMHDLWELHLQRNRLASVPDGVLNALVNLRVLRLSDNQLLSVPSEALARLTSLRLLSLSGNLVEELPALAFPNLRELSVLTMDNNVISDINAAAFEGLVSLERLDLADNNITVVPGAGAPLGRLRRLSYLDLSGNMFSSIGPMSFQSLVELRVIRLNRLVRLTRVDARAFADNKRLEAVSLEGNVKLTSLPTRLFHGSPLLSRVSVRGSALTSLEAAHFPLDRLQALDVADVPLTCNCSLLWLWLLCREQRQHVLVNETAETAETPPTSAAATPGPEPAALTLPHPILDVDGIRCSGPADLKGFALADVPESEVRCEATWMAVVMVTVVVLALFAATCTVLFFLSSGRWCGSEKDASDVSTDSFATQHSSLHKHHGHGGLTGGLPTGLPTHPPLPGGQVMMLPTDMKVEPTYATIGLPNGRPYGDYKKETDHLVNVNAYQRALNNWDSSFNGGVGGGGGGGGDGGHHTLTMGRSNHHGDQIRHGKLQAGSYGTYHNQNHNHYSMAIDMTKKPPHIVYV